MIGGALRAKSLTFANTAGPDKMTYNVPFHLGLHYMPDSFPVHKDEKFVSFIHITVNSLKLKTPVSSAYRKEDFLSKRVNEFSLS